jgi:hypothetical protein
MQMYNINSHLLTSGFTPSRFCMHFFPLRDTGPSHPIHIDLLMPVVFGSRNFTYGGGLLKFLKQLHWKIMFHIWNFVILLQSIKGGGDYTRKSIERFFCHI